MSYMRLGLEAHVLEMASTRYIVSVVDRVHGHMIVSLICGQKCYGVRLPLTVVSP